MNAVASRGTKVSYHYACSFASAGRGNRLQASLIETRRIGAKIAAEHIGALGSVDAAVSLRERLAFWTALPGRLARLGNRVVPDEHPKIIGALHARIPMVTAEEQREIQEQNAKDDERFWDGMRDMNAASVEEHKRLIAAAEAKKAAFERAAAEAGERLETAKDRLARLKRGELIAGGLGKKLDVPAVMKAAGFTLKQTKRMALLGGLTGEDFESLLKQIDTVAVVDKALEREARRRGLGGPSSSS